MKVKKQRKIKKTRVALQVPKTTTNDINFEEIIIDIIIQQWRLLKLFEKAISKLEILEQNRYLNQLRYIQKSVQNNLDKVNLSLVNLENEPYDIGMAANALNLDDFDVDDVLVVEQMLEPLIIKDGVVKKIAVVNLGKVVK